MHALLCCAVPCAPVHAVPCLDIPCLVWLGLQIAPSCTECSGSHSETRTPNSKRQQAASQTADAMSTGRTAPGARITGDTCRHPHTNGQTDRAPVRARTSDRPTASLMCPNRSRGGKRRPSRPLVRRMSASSNTCSHAVDLVIRKVRALGTHSQPPPPPPPPPQPATSRQHAH